MNMLAQIFVAIALAVGIQAQVPTGSNPFQILPNVDRKQCLTAGNFNGAPVTYQACLFDISADQSWTFTGQGGQVRVHGSKCLDVTNGAQQNGTKVQVWDCADGNTNQNWFYTGDQRLAWTNHGFCSDVENGNAEDGNVLQIWACTTGNTNQVFVARPISSLITTTISTTPAATATASSS